MVKVNEELLKACESALKALELARKHEFYMYQDEIAYLKTTIEKAKMLLELDKIGEQWEITKIELIESKPESKLTKLDDGTYVYCLERSSLIEIEGLKKYVIDSPYPVTDEQIKNINKNWDNFLRDDHQHIFVLHPGLILKK